MDEGEDDNDNNDPVVQSEIDKTRNAIEVCEKFSVFTRFKNDIVKALNEGIYLFIYIMIIQVKHVHKNRSTYITCAVDKEVYYCRKQLPSTDYSMPQPHRLKWS